MVRKEVVLAIMTVVDEEKDEKKVSHNKNVGKAMNQQKKYVPWISLYYSKSPTRPKNS